MNANADFYIQYGSVLMNACWLLTVLNVKYNENMLQGDRPVHAAVIIL